MLLLAQDREKLFRLLPEQGNLGTLKILRKLRESLAFTDEEKKAWNFQFLPDGNWQIDGTKKADIPIGATETAIIRHQLEMMDAQAMLTEAHVDLWAAFFPESVEADQVKA